eukprot:1259815-Rhodomonas_salina.1
MEISERQPLSGSSKVDNNNLPLKQASSHKQLNNNLDADCTRVATYEILLFPMLRKAGRNLN